MKRKSFIVAVALAIAGWFSAFADNAYSYNSIGNGLSYISIEQNLDSFAFNVDRYGSFERQAGKVGYFVFTDEMQSDEVVDYIANNGQYIGENEARVELSGLAAGSKIGFYQTDIEGALINQFTFTTEGVDKDGAIKVDFDEAVAEEDYSITGEKTNKKGGWQFGKLGLTDEIAAQGMKMKDYMESHGKGNSTTQVYGSSGTSWSELDWDDWMQISNISAVVAKVEDAAYKNAQGAPLPGALAVLLIGGLAAGALKLRRKQAS